MRTRCSFVWRSIFNNPEPEPSAVTPSFLFVGNTLPHKWRKIKILREFWDTLYRGNISGSCLVNSGSDFKRSPRIDAMFAHNVSRIILHLVVAPRYALWKMLARISRNKLICDAVFPRANIPPRVNDPLCLFARRTEKDMLALLAMTIAASSLSGTISVSTAVKNYVGFFSITVISRDGAITYCYLNVKQAENWNCSSGTNWKCSFRGNDGAARVCRLKKYFFDLYSK